MGGLIMVFVYDPLDYRDFIGFPILGFLVD
jgi:hypothetical protein